MAKFKGIKAKSRTRVSGESYDKPGDTAYNARRRYTRSSERYLSKAENSTGVMAERYRELARGDLKRALATYEKEPKSGGVKRLMGRLGVSMPERSLSPESRKQLIEESKTALEGLRQKPETRRELEARSILNSKIGKRIYGGLIELWKDKAGAGSEDFDRSVIEPAILEHFGVESMADVIEILEQEINLYADPEKEEKYDDVRLMVEQFAARGKNQG